MGKSMRKILAFIVSLAILATFCAVPMTASAAPPAGETYDDYDVITYADFLDTGNNHLSLDGVTLTAQNNLFHYDAASSSHSVILKFRYVAGAVVYFQMFPGAYRSNDPFAYRIKDATTYEKRYSPNSGTVTVSAIAEGDQIDFEIARLLVASGDNAGKYYTYLKANGTLLFEAYATTDQISGTDLDDSIQLNLNGSNSCVIKATPAVVEQEAADATYYYYDEIGYEDLFYNGNPLADETQLGSRLLTYNATANTYSVILKYRWKAVEGSKFQISFDRKGSENAINYMFGAQLYAPGSEGHVNSSLRLRPGLDSNAWNDLPEEIVTGTYYDVEFARLKVKNGDNAGKYYMYFKINDVLVSESYVAADVVDSEGNYTSNPGSTACHLSNEIYITFWGADGNKISAIPVPETYEDYDVVTYYDLLQGGNPLTASQTALSGNPKFAYNATSPSYSVIFKYRWTAGTYSEGKPYYVFYFDKWGGSAYPFCLAVKSPGYSGLGAAAGENGAWHLDPSKADHIVQMSEPIVAGGTYDIEHARLMVATGPNAGKYYVYVKVNGELIYDYYYAGDNGNGTYGTDNQAYDPSYLRFTDGTSDNYISAIPEPETYEDYDEVTYKDFLKNGNPLGDDYSINGQKFTYNKTSESGSAIISYRWKGANVGSSFYISFDPPPKTSDPSQSATEFTFGIMYNGVSDSRPTGTVWLRIGNGSSKALDEALVMGNDYDIEFARLKVATGPNKGKYKLSFKITDPVTEQVKYYEEKYIEKNVVDSNGQYVTNTDGAGSGVTCTISNEFYMTFWGNGGGNKIAPIPVPETYDAYDEVNFDDLYEGGVSVAGTVKDGNHTFTYNATSPSYSSIIKYRWTPGGDTLKFTQFLDDWVYPFCFAAKAPNQAGFGATAGPNGSWHLVPSKDSYIVDMDEPVTAGEPYDVEFGRLKVITGANTGKYFVYVKVNSELIQSYYYDGVSDGTYGSGTALSNKIIISAPAGNKFSDISGGPVHIHSAASEWSSDADNHWHACTGCEEKLDNAAHTFDDGVVTAPSCTEGGYTTYTCTVCGYSYTADEVAATGHSIGEWLSDATDHWHVCAECGEILDKAAHTFDDGVVTAPSCTKGGYTTYTCTVCGYSYTADETAALGHDYVAAVTAPTCTEGGYTTHTCSRCGDSYVTDEIPATGHTLGEWLSDAENHWKVCENCSGEIDKAAHTPSVWILDVPATAEATGLKHKECTVCGAVIETAVIEKIVMPDIQPGEGVPEIAVDSKTAHAGQTVDVTISLKNNPGISSMKLVVTYGAGLILKSPVVYNICSEEDPNMPYTMQPQSYASPVLLNWVSPITEMTDDTVYATLTFEIAADAEGDQDVTVFYNPKDVFNANEENVAFAVTNGKVTVAADHSFTNYVSNNDATCTADGTKTAKCDYCDVTNTITDEGSALGHDYAAVVTAPTCTEAGYTTY
ncbi:MAG: hypothetical protein J5662_08210, partial [Clostridia bacterium]|nr:hypothetical protein [Clostridia bacterium]